MRPNLRFEKFEVRYPKPAGLKNDVNSMRSGERINKYCYGCGLSGGCLISKMQLCFQLLLEVGFEAVTVENRTRQFGDIIENELENFEKSKAEFIKVF